MDFFIKGWQFWPADPSPDAEISDPVSSPWPALPQVPAMQRRRLSPLTKIAFDVAFSQPVAADTPLVFASRHGDLHKTLELLTDVVQQQALSPTQFALSVHNAIVGQYSIFQQHQAPHSAVAGGDSSLHYAVLEAVGLMTDPQVSEVLVVYADQPVPELYQCFAAQPATAQAVALLLSKTEGEAVQLRYQGQATQQPQTPETNEVQQLRDFLQYNKMYCDISSQSASWQWQRRPYVAKD
jgi:hypothetical protein